MSNGPSRTGQLLRLSQAARLTGLTVHILRTDIDAGELKAARLSTGERRISHDDLRRYCQRLQIQFATSAGA